MWFPIVCIGIRSIDWQMFNDKILPKAYKLAGFVQTANTRNAAAQIIISACIIAAEKKKLENSKLLQSYFDLCQESDINIRKSALNTLKILFEKIEKSNVESMFFSEV